MKLYYPLSLGPSKELGEAWQPTQAKRGLEWGTRTFVAKVEIVSAVRNPDSFERPMISSGNFHS
jgi:hypothetical protein